MIQLTVIDSIDSNKCMQYTFYKNLIYIGSHPSCDLFFNDKLLSNIHIFIEIIDSKLLIHLDKSTEYIHVNGKKTTAHKTIQIGSSIVIGNNTFKIDNFLYEVQEDYKTKLNELTEKIINEDPDTLKILQELQE